MHVGSRSLRILITGSVAMLAAACAEPGDNATARGLVLQPQEPIFYPGPPTVIRVLLRFDGEQFHILKTTEKRGSVLQPRILENVSDIHDGTQLVFQYRAFNIEGHEVYSGMLLVPWVARAEWLDPDEPNVIRRTTEKLDNSTVSMNIPHTENVATIEFLRLQPAGTEPVERWRKIPANTVQLQTSKRQLHDSVQ